VAAGPRGSLQAQPGFAVARTSEAGAEDKAGFVHPQIHADSARTTFRAKSAKRRNLPIKRVRCSCWRPPGCSGQSADPSVLRRIVWLT
jgi:hypothetical protein